MKINYGAVIIDGLIITGVFCCIILGKYAGFFLLPLLLLTGGYKIKN